MSEFEDGPLTIGRQMGKHFQGAVYRGSTRALGASPVRATATIPSKFETVINVGTKERDGFGSRSHRFNAFETEAPGPGLYFKQMDPNYTTPSIGQRGFGAMLSNDKRLKSNKEWRAPGPGAYDQKRWEGEMRRVDFSKAKYTPHFAAPHPAAAALTKAKQEHLPGPGQYGAPKVDIGQGRKLVDKASAFKSKLDRFGKHSVTGGASVAGEKPAPGQYETHKSTLSTHGTTSGFVSRTARGGGVPGGGAAPSFGAPSVIYGDEARGPGEPGPGSHHSTYLDMENKFKHAPKCYSAFGKVTTDRFGVPNEPKTRRLVVPGPGAYAVAPHEDVRRINGASSAFVSASARLQQEAASTLAAVIKPPGPAFYTDTSAQVFEKKRFNLNARKLWI